MKRTVLVVSLFVSIVVLVVLIYGCGRSPLGGDTVVGSPWIYVGSTMDNSILVINGTTNTTVESIQLGIAPANMAASPNGRRLYVSTDNGDIYVIDTATNTSVDAFSIPGLDSYGMAVSHDNRYLYLTALATSELFKVDLTAGGYPVTSAMLLGQGGKIALNSNSTKAYVCVPGNEDLTSLEVINLVTMTKEASIGIINHPHDITILGDYAYIAMSSIDHCVGRVKLSDLSFDTIYEGLHNMWGIVSIPGKNKIYLSDCKDPGTIYVLVPENFPTFEATTISSSEFFYPNYMAATNKYAYIIDPEAAHDKIAVVDVNTDTLVKYIYGLNAYGNSANPVVVYK